jgi:hypothetical protein
MEGGGIYLEGGGTEPGESRSDDGGKSACMEGGDSDQKGDRIIHRGRRDQPLEGEDRPWRE